MQEQNKEQWSRIDDADLIEGLAWNGSGFRAETTRPQGAAAPIGKSGAALITGRDRDFYPGVLTNRR